MYGGFDVFKTYLGIKLHFTTDTYDWFKYEGKVNCKLDTFTKRNDRYFFHKISTRYPKDEVVNYFVANFMDGMDKWVGDLARKNGTEIYTNFKKRLESFSYHFRGNCSFLADRFRSDGISFDSGFIVSNGQHPYVLRLLLGKKISYETIIVLDHYLGFIKVWDMQIKENFIWPEVSKKIKKYKPFFKFNQTKCKLIMKEVFTDGR
tara:strand:- start:345 stop:959 length:615 start_codon:yes stop_codon:yes gene_type:complete